MAEERISSEEIESDESEGSQSSYSSSDNEDEEPVLKYKSSLLWGHSRVM
jgi:hypothetical protein